MTASDSSFSPPVIAIDGPAAAGKGTLARRLAAWFRFAYLDSGLLYRAVGMKVQENGEDPTDTQAAVRAAKSLMPRELENPSLRGDEAAQLASIVAAIAEVREALLDFQRRFAANPPDGLKGSVIDGRDIGTVVCPDTPHKLFITASLEVRAQRRLKELRERGIESIHGRVLQEMKDRDIRDRERDVAPLTKAKDAFFLDTTQMDADEVFAAAEDHLSSFGLKPNS